MIKEIQKQDHDLGMLGMFRTSIFFSAKFYKGFMKFKSFVQRDLVVVEVARVFLHVVANTALQ